MAQGDHRGERPGQRRHLVGEGDRWEQRTAVGLAAQRGESAHRLGEGGEAGALGVRAVLAESGDAQDDEPGVRRQQRVRCQVEGLQLARAHVLDEHVGGVEQLAHARVPGRVLEVERDAALAPAEDLPEQRVGVPRGRPAHPPGRVAGRCLDLDHVGPEVGEVLGRPGPATTVAMSTTRTRRGRS